MAENELELKSANGESLEKKIPVFTVFKNSSILKNIFLLDGPPAVSSGEEDSEEILVIGRHPDCNITLDHPSISRFHLRLYLKPSSLKLSVFDLSSVHGTWVSGKKIEAGVRVELNEGDIVRLGGSSRLYVLHWVPLTRAYDSSDPFVPPTNVLVPVKEGGEEEDQISFDHSKDENFWSVEKNQTQSPYSDLEGLDSLFSSTNKLSSSAKQFSPSTLAAPEFENSSYYDEDDPENRNLSIEDHEESGNSGVSSGFLLNEPIVETENQQSNKENEDPKQYLDKVLTGTANIESSSRNFVQNMNLLEVFNSSLSDEEVETLCASYMEHEQEKVSRLGYNPATRSLDTSSALVSLGSKDQLFLNKQNHDPKTFLGAGVSSYYDEDEAENRNLSREENEEREISCFSSGLLLKKPIVGIENQQSNKENENPKHLVGVLTGTANTESPTKNFEQNRNLLEVFNFSLSADKVEIHCTSDMDHGQEKLSSPNNQISTRTLDISMAFSFATLRGKDQLSLDEQNHDPEIISGKGVSARSSLDSTEKKSGKENNWPGNLNISLSVHGEHLVGERPDAADNQSSLKSNDRQKENPDLCFGALKTDSVKLLLPGESISTEIGGEKLEEINNLLHTSSTNVSQPKDASGPAMSSEQRSDLPNIWSRRGKATSVHIQTDNQKRNNMWVTTDTEVEVPHKENMESESIAKMLFFSEEGDEEEIFTPEKENFTPNTLLLRSILKTDKVGKINHFKPLGKSPLKNLIGSNVDEGEVSLVSSCKENDTPKVVQDCKLVTPASKNHARLDVEVAAKESRVNREPFQSMLLNSSSKSNSRASICDTSVEICSSVNNVQSAIKNTVMGENKRWIMVADTNCFLNTESRKALQHMQGLKGTRLIIPRIVIRELDCMKRRGYLFKRTKEISSALQWIEDCMLKTNWWIHVQGSVEEGRHLAPTPPASPLSTFKVENVGFRFNPAPFSASGNFEDIVSPTAGDHILECALFFRKVKYDEQLVILSNDVSLKIKAMAEGIICEEAEEFRESLVNPFSQRFSWADSSPRGLTWSSVDEVALRERYYCGAFKKPSSISAEGIKGLKLILLHNSQLGQLISSAEIKQM